MQEYNIPDAVTAAEIKEKRKELGVTQKEFASLVGVSKPTVERWEAGDKPICGPIVSLLRMLTPEYVESIKVPEKAYPLRLWYMYENEPCTVIDVSDSKKKIKIKNFTDNMQFRAFGVNTEPTYEDYEEFLESRCFPKTRDKMKLILKDLELPFYDPFMIIQKTEGRMAEDDFWIKTEND